MQIKDKLVQYIEGLLTEEEKASVDDHLEECNECRKELSSIAEIRERLFLSSRQSRSADLETKVLDRIIYEQNKRLKGHFRSNPWLESWRSMMKSRKTRLSVATAVVIVIIIFISLFNKSEPVATAQDVLSEAVKATAGLNSIHMKGQMRTEPGSYIEFIDLTQDFTPIEIWKKIDQKGHLKWRLEKKGAFVIKDGNTTTFYYENKFAEKSDDPNPLGSGYNTWMMQIMDIHELLDRELKLAKDKPNHQIRLTHKNINGKDKIMLEVNEQTIIPEDNLIKNRSVISSDSLQFFQFDKDTNLLEGLKVYVIDNGQEILVFETTEIEYNAQIDDSVFIPNLPYDVMWESSKSKILPDNDKYARMTPKEVAVAFLDAASKEDWSELSQFWYGDDINQRDRDILGGLESISLGEPAMIASGANPFRFGHIYQIWSISYKIKLKNGDMREKKLALSNDNSAERYIVLEY